MKKSVKRTGLGGQSMKWARQFFPDLMCSWQLDPVWKVSELIDQLVFCVSASRERINNGYF